MTTEAAPNLYSVEGVQAKVREGISRLDAQLSQYKYCNDVERITGVPKSYVILGAGALFFIMIFFNIAGQLLTNTVSWVYPGMWIMCIYLYTRFIHLLFKCSLRVLQGYRISTNF